MGLPVMTIIFAAAAKESVERSDRGVVGMVVKDTAPSTNPVVVFREKDIPSTLSAGAKEQIQLALKGGVNVLPDGGDRRPDNRGGQLGESAARRAE